MSATELRLIELAEYDEVLIKHIVPLVTKDPERAATLLCNEDLAVAECALLRLECNPEFKIIQCIETSRVYGPFQSSKMVLHQLSMFEKWDPTHTYVVRDLRQGYCT